MPRNNLPIEENNSILIIPDFDVFGYYLYDRIYVMLRHFGLITHEYTIFLILRDRSSLAALRENKFLYVGLDRQREFLEMHVRNIHTPSCWKELQDNPLDLDLLPDTRSIMDSFNDNTITLEGIKEPKFVSDTYKLSDRSAWSAAYEREYQVLESYFEDPRELQYFGLPVFQFGELDGMAQIILTEKDIFDDEVAKKLRASTIRENALIITREYENLVWVWSLGNEDNLDIRQEFTHNRADLVSNAEKKIKESNKQIFNELGYLEYYTLSKPYFKRRIDEIQEVIDDYLAEHRRRAIVSILVDSYAHNISAHSLTVLKWLFQQRAATTDLEAEAVVELAAGTKEFAEAIQGHIEEAGYKAPETGPIIKSLDAITRRWSKQASLLEASQNNHQLIPVRDQAGPLSEELIQLLRYLAEKGAFWNGVGRQEQFGGESRNLYDILFHDFFNNPLFLGTIAYSEGITKINLRVRIYEKRDKTDPRQDGSQLLRRTYRISRDEEGRLMDGILATVDLSTAGEFVFRHPFFRKGEAHEQLKTQLEKLEAYFPGGVVGRHAFYTIIENELRNVKHFPAEARREMAREGLTLTVAILPKFLPKYLRTVSTDYSLYKIGVWIHKPNQLYHPHEKVFFTVRRVRELRDDVVTEKQRPRLGGNHQDKICASMLLTGSFAHVQAGKEAPLVTEDNPYASESAKRAMALGQHYFPWIRAAHSYDVEAEDETLEHDYEFRWKNLENALYEQALAQLDPSKKGFFKKYFYLWRGEFVYYLGKDGSSLQAENLGRFTFVAVDNDSAFSTARQAGVIRVLRNLPREAKREQIYCRWLREWLGEKDRLITLSIGKTEVGFLLLIDQELTYYNRAEYLDTFSLNDHAYLPFDKFRFEHRDRAMNTDLQTEWLNLRNHGMLRTRFFPDVNQLDQLENSKIAGGLQACELTEVLLTHICIIDDRIANRVTDARRRFLNDQLHCDLHNEEEENWAKITAEPLSRYHFFVIHLAYLARISDAQGVPYSEHRIQEFIENEIISNWEETPDNFILVITTGRGRAEWWNKIQQDAHITRFTTFRPCESLINAVENAIQLNDDFELKYNLVKVLFGS